MKRPFITLASALRHGGVLPAQSCQQGSRERSWLWKPLKTKWKSWKTTRGSNLFKHTSVNNVLGGVKNPEKNTKRIQPLQRRRDYVTTSRWPKGRTKPTAIGVPSHRRWSTYWSSRRYAAQEPPGWRVSHCRPFLLCKKWRNSWNIQPKVLFTMKTSYLWLTALGWNPIDLSYKLLLNGTPPALPHLGEEMKRLRPRGASLASADDLEMKGGRRARSQLKRFLW